MMLKMLRDTDVHKVYTAVCLMKPMEEAKDPGYDMETCVEETIVKFDDTGKSIHCCSIAINDEKHGHVKYKYTGSCSIPATCRMIICKGTMLMAW